MIHIPCHVSVFCTISSFFRIVTVKHLLNGTCQQGEKFSLLMFRYRQVSVYKFRFGMYITQVLYELGLDSYISVLSSRYQISKNWYMLFFRMRDNGHDFPLMCSFIHAV